MTALPPVDSAVDHIAGSIDAEFVLIEYCDFQCPYCGAAYYELKQLQQAMGSRLCQVFRHFPLTEIHPHALRAAIFAQAAASIGKFWVMHDMLFENQRVLDERGLVRYARAIGMNEPLIEQALGDPFGAAVRRDIRGGVNSGVHGTPYLFINGERFDGRVTSAALLHAFAATAR